MKLCSVVVGLWLSGTMLAAVPDRITTPVDNRTARPVGGTLHRLAAPAFDLGPVDPAMAIGHAILLVKPSAAQQNDLDQLLSDQQNPSSPHFHEWLTPEKFGDRFGLSARDLARVSAWLTGQGLSVLETAPGQNWIAFRGSAANIGRAFRTSFHRYKVGGETHFANASEISVPAALADIVGGITGLNDFRPNPPLPITGTPDYTSGKNHYIAPGDFATIYNVAPLTAAGFDGTGQSVAVVGQSSILVSDVRSFRADFGLPANDPKIVLFGPDPGVTGAQIEGNLDVEWSGAVAPKATVYYVYSTSFLNAIIGAVSLNVAPVISVSYGFCEVDSPPIVRTVAQQANAQGITILSASGDAGGGGCDIQGDLSLATHGNRVSFPSNLPEVTGMGGTMFSDGAGSYWAASNSTTGATALSYIPEVAWNESSPSVGLLASAGGASALYAKPAWQAGPGVPDDGRRDSPDLALNSAAEHDGYLITMNGNVLYVVGGTSAAAPAMAGVLAILNQYAVKTAIQKTAGLGNINAQLYRMAQTTPAAFHDIVSGDTIVPCEQASPDCLTGSYGFAAGPGYDQATGLGSIDANVLVTSWGAAASPVTVTLTASATKVTLNDTVTVTAKVTPVHAGIAPTGVVNFTLLGQALGSATLSTNGSLTTAAITFPAWKIGVGTGTVGASYAGDASYTAGAATIRIQSTLPTAMGVAAVTAQVSGPVFGFQVGNEPPTWQAEMILQELAGVPAMLTGFAIDGVSQPLSESFPSPNIPAKGRLVSTIVLRNVATPAVKTFAFDGIDVSGQTWRREVQVDFRGAPVAAINFNLWADPLNIQQNTTAQTNCPWAQQLVVEEDGGYELHLVALLQGSVDISAQIPLIFGTTRLAPYGIVQGRLCWTGVAAPGESSIQLLVADDYGGEFEEEVKVTFAGPSTTGAQLSVSPAHVTLQSSKLAIFQTPVTLNVALTDKTQPWTARVYPGNRSTSWLSLSAYSGTGPATLTLQANGDGLPAGAYYGLVVIQSPSALPQYVSIPVMFVNGTTGGPAISSVTNGLSFAPTASPGMILSVFGSQLANTVEAASGLPLTTSLGGVSATVNGWPAPILYVSPDQLNIQIPYETTAGLAALGVNNNGQIGGFQFQVSPAAPGILTAGGSVLPAVSARNGSYATLYVTGTGDISTRLPAGVPVSSGTPVTNLPVPLLPLTVSVAGLPAIVQFAGSTAGVVGLSQINFVIPAGVAPGVQPVVVTVGGFPSMAANITVTP